MGAQNLIGDSYMNLPGVTLFRGLRVNNAGRKPQDPEKRRGKNYFRPLVSWNHMLEQNSTEILMDRLQNRGWSFWPTLPIELTPAREESTRGYYLRMLQRQYSQMRRLL